MKVKNNHLPGDKQVGLRPELKLNTQSEEMKKVIGIDVGASIIKGGLINSKGEILQEKKILTQSQEGPEKIIEKIKKLIDDLWEIKEEPIAIGIGCPGPIDLSSGLVMEPPNLPGWEKVALAKILEKHFRLPVELNNDANVAILGEAWLGAGQGEKNILMLTLGTGVGGGAILDGKLLIGQLGMASEFGHIILDPQGPPCGCGQRGCLESFVAAPRLVELAKENRLSISSARQIFEKARTGDLIAQKIIDQMVFWLSIGTANLINIFNPNMIIIGGGLSKSWDLFGEKLQKQAKKLAFPLASKKVKIIPAKLGDRAGILGAARLALGC